MAPMARSLRMAAAMDSEGGGVGLGKAAPSAAGMRAA